VSRSSALGADPAALRPFRRRPSRRYRGARIFGTTLFALGAILVTIVGVQLLRGTIARERARAEWAKLMQSASFTAVADLGRKRRIASGKPVTRVIIPSIRLDEVVVEGLGDRDLWAGPGHMPGTVLPGENGNSIVSAHRDRHFHRLDDVRVGDVIETQTEQMSVRWRITTRQIVQKDEKAIFETTEPTLTLTTCWPTRYFGSAPDRLLITAVPVSMRERTATPPAVRPSAASK